MKTFHYLFGILLYLPFVSYSQTDSTQPQKKPLIFTFVEQNPEYPGGDESLMKFIRLNSKFPIDKTYKGRKVLIRFVVEPDGSVNEVTVTRSINPELDAEAIRLAKLLWFVPGKQQGKPVRVYFNLPVTFL